MPGVQSSSQGNHNHSKEEGNRGNGSTRSSGRQERTMQAGEEGASAACTMQEGEEGVSAASTKTTHYCTFQSSSLSSQSAFCAIQDRVRQQHMQLQPLQQHLEPPLPQASQHEQLQSRQHQQQPPQHMKQQQQQRFQATAFPRTHSYQHLTIGSLNSHCAHCGSPLLAALPYTPTTSLALPQGYPGAHAALISRVSLFVCDYFTCQLVKCVIDFTCQLVCVWLISLVSLFVFSR
jgi:hypothetical protein